MNCPCVIQKLAEIELFSPITAAEEMTTARPAYDFKDLKKGGPKTTNQKLLRHDVMLFPNLLSKRS
jgi:hypothetical protein